MDSKKIAVMQVNNMQYLVKEGETVAIDRYPGEAGDKIKFEEVLLMIDGKDITVGTPTVAKAVVEVEIIAHTQGKKVRTFTYKAKTRERKASGNREKFTEVKILKIN